VLPLSLLSLVRVGQVTYRRITGPEIRRAICVVALKARSLSPAAQAFVAQCVTAAHERGAPEKADRPTRRRPAARA